MKTPQKVIIQGNGTSDRALLAFYLQSRGHVVTVCDSESDWNEMVSSEEFDMAFVDSSFEKAGHHAREMQRKMLIIGLAPGQTPGFPWDVMFREPVVRTDLHNFELGAARD